MTWLAPISAEQEAQLQKAGWEHLGGGIWRQPAPQREDAYQAGLMRAVEIASTSCSYCSEGKRTGLPGNACENCMNTGLHYASVYEVAAAIHAEAAAPNLTAPRVVEQGEPIGRYARDGLKPGDTVYIRAIVADNIGARMPTNWPIQVVVDRGASETIDSGGKVHYTALYAAPPASMPAEEVTEAIRDECIEAGAHALQSYDESLDNDDACEMSALVFEAVRAALTAARPRADAGVTEAQVNAALGASHGLVGAATVRNMLRAALAAREVQ